MSKTDHINFTPQEIKRCRALTKEFGTSYFYATQLFPREKRLATYALYSFFRLPDEIVDTERIDMKEKLATFKSDWEAAYGGGLVSEPVLTATAKVFKKYDIPFSLSVDFLAAMEQDISKERYETYANLQDYMYGSAEVVGLMMSYVVGFSDDSALQYAKKLGEAMQYTNFLRDIGEDYDDRGRIYIPRETLETYGVTEEMIREKRLTTEFKEMMADQVEFTRKLYTKAEPGIAMLNMDGRFAVRAASRLYEGILDKIIAADYDVLNNRVYTTKLDKLKLLCKRKKQ